jgi:methylmalonyl-CoA mutase N-terminal domain/subunit
MRDNELEKREKHWREKRLQPVLDRFPPRRKDFKTGSDIPLPDIQLPEDSDYLASLGFPGEYPFTRGVQPNMYRGRLWTMRQYAGYASAQETNRRFRYLLEKGQTGLSVAFDLPTQIGYDADNPISLGEVGKVGVSISSIEDMETLLADIPLDRVSTSMTINAPASVLLAMVVAVARRRGIEPEKLRGTIQNDILKEYIARGTYIYPPKPSMRLITDVFQYCQQTIPNWNTISISGYHIREAGSTAVQEIAFTLANAIEYVKAASDSGLEVDGFAPKLSFFFNAHTNFLEEVAKFRAARRLWARIMRERFSARDPRSWKMRFHTQTAGSTLTAQQPENNIVRVTLQALAAVLGGTQSLHTNSMDEALWLPTEKAVRIALRTQQIIAEESGVPDVVDPLGGSYTIEYLTDQIEELATEYIERIDAMGGMLQAIQTGYIQNEIQSAAYRAQKELESGEQLIVGVNAYREDEQINLESLRVDPRIEIEQRKRLERLRASRDQSRVQDLLERLSAAARNDENLMPLFVECVDNKVTLGEICNLLRDIWGEYEPATFM